jgi:hypothetical protein
MLCVKVKGTRCGLLNFRTMDVSAAPGFKLPPVAAGSHTAVPRPLAGGVGELDPAGVIA